MAGFELNEWIARSPEQVFDFVTDTTHASQLMKSVKQMEKLTAGPTGVGTQYRETRVINGKEAQALLEIAAYERPETYTVRNTTEGIETIYNYTFHLEGDGTRVTLVCEVNAGGLKKVMLPMVVAVLKKEDGDHLARLKAAVESD
jgi:carbon monoxide dehydrogenase subunit G